MISRSWVFWFCGVCLGLVGESVAATRVFTDQAGRRLEAELTSHDGTTVKLRTADGSVAEVAIASLSPADQAHVRAWQPETDSTVSVAAVVPGESVTLPFPDLPAMASGGEAICEVHIPRSYDPARPVPLFVWMSGGPGSARVGSARGLVDFDRFVVVALPFPGNIPSIRDAVPAGKVGEVWEYHRPMLEKVAELVPNVDPAIRIVGGTSNGAHAIGSGLDERWKGFVDGFTAFILHEGGSSPGGVYRGARGKTVLLAYGEDTHVLPYQAELIETFKHARPELTVEPIPGEGHGLGEEGRRRIREWVDRTFPPTGGQ